MNKILLIVFSLIITTPHFIYSQVDNDVYLLEGSIDKFLNASAKNGYSASVLVAKNDEILFSKGYGWADRKNKIQNKSQTVFNIGSVTKQFTAAAILKLQELNLLNVSDPLIKYFPQVTSDKKDITIHQLLAQTSGISPQTGGYRYDEATKEDFLNECFSSELMYLPGTKYTYANANYILLAAIIEKVTNQDYETFLREAFWEPLNMNHTGYKSIGFNSEEIAHGYYFHYTSGEWRDWGITQTYLPYNDNHWYSIGKGDVYSTVEDLYVWHQALKRGSVLRPETVKLIETAHVPENDEKTSYYGYGWAIFNSKNNSKIVTHNGSNGIYFADFIRNVDEDIVVIVLSNIRLNHQSENVGWEIYRMLSDNGYQPQLVPKNTYELVFDFMRANSPEQIANLNQFIKDKTGSFIYDKAILNRIGFKQISEKISSEWGIALLELNVKLFPDDGNLWDSLGEGYYLIADKENAIRCFNKAIELSNETDCYWCENSKKRLKELSGIKQLK